VSHRYPFTEHCWQQLSASATVTPSWSAATKCTSHSTNRSVASSAMLRAEHAVICATALLLRGASADGRLQRASHLQRQQCCCATVLLR
jgi:hypothetical protein